MFPVLDPSADKGFSVEKCCYKCPDNCVEKDGKCVTASEWEAVQDFSSNWLAVRYAPYDDPTGEKPTTYHMGTLDKSPTELIQYGGTDSGGQCNFSVKDAVAVSQDNLIEQNQVANMCSKKCGSKQECDAVIYAKRGGDWLTWIKGYVGGDTACKLEPGITMSDLFTQKFYYTTNMQLYWEGLKEPVNNNIRTDFSWRPSSFVTSGSLSFPAQNPTDDRSGDPAHGLQADTQAKAWATLSLWCQNKAGGACASASGIPNASTETVTLYSTNTGKPGSHITGGTLTVSVSPVNVSYMYLDKYTCKRNSNTIGEACYPSNM